MRENFPWIRVIGELETLIYFENLSECILTDMAISLQIWPTSSMAWAIQVEVLLL